LIGWTFWTGIAIGSLALLMLQHLTGGGWGLVIRRVLEAATRTLPFMAILFLPIILGAHSLYHEWADHEEAAAHPVVQLKTGYLNVPFFAVRAVVYFAVWIALAYLFAGLLFIFLKPRALAIAAAALLVGYWALLTFVPAPGEPLVAGTRHVSFAEGHNLTNWIDAHYLPGRKWDGDHDPEGILSTLPAIAGCVLGVFAGLLLKSPTVPPLRKVNTVR